MKWVDCVCGGLIRWQDLPESMIVDARTGIWIHDTGDILCYPDDQMAFATPTTKWRSENPTKPSGADRSVTDGDD